MANTQPLAGNETRSMEEIHSNRLYLKKNILFEGKNGSYEINANRLIGAGGESLVYMANRVSDNEEVIAKIYDEYADSAANRANRKKIIGFLESNSDYRKSHIMPLWDNGRITIESDDGDDFLVPVDIIPFCKDGELKHCDYRTLRDKVIPEILYAINLLHSSNLVHRDIKPNNIYMLNGSVVVADFGTSGEISANDKFDYIGTQKKRGTVGYTAPEVWQGYAVIASDYYSFGCTIAALYKGEHVYQRLIDDSKKDDTPVKIAINKKGLPLECPPNEADLQVLVDVLVIMDETDRAGYEDVLLWLNDPEAFANKWSNPRLFRDGGFSREFNFEGTPCNNEAELTEALLQQRDDAIRYLYRGDLILNFFKNENQTLADRIYKILESRETAQNHDLGMAMFLHYLNTADNPKCPIYWCGDTYESLSEISAAIFEGRADAGKIIAMLKSKFLSWKFENTREGASQETIDALKEIENITSVYPVLGYYVFMYKSDPRREINLESVDEYFGHITQQDNNWYKTAAGIIEDDKILAYLLVKGGTGAVQDFKKSLGGTFISDEGDSDLTKLYLLFEGFCSDKLPVRKHYLQFGPQSYLYWLQQNLNLYSFNSERAKKLESRIKDSRLNENMSINEINNALFSLKTSLLEEGFGQLFQNNYLLTYMGLHTDKDSTGITTDNSHAFFAGNFFGISVPVGYIKTNRYAG